MPKIALIILYVILFSGFGFTQSVDVENLIKEGVAHYDNQEFDMALDKFEKALEEDPESVVAHYESSMTYFALAQYEKAIYHSELIIENQWNHMDQAYIIKGSSLDQLGQSEKAIKVYQKGD